MCTVLPLKQDCFGSNNGKNNSAAKKRTRQDAFSTHTSIVAPRDIVADEMLMLATALPSMKRPRSCFHQTSTTTKTSSATLTTQPSVPTKIHIIPQKTVMFADQMEQQKPDDEDDSSSSSNEEDDGSVISIIDSVLGLAGDITSTATQSDTKLTEEVVKDHDDQHGGEDTWYHREELRSFQVEARNEVLADLARRVADHNKSRKNTGSSGNTSTATHVSSKSNKLKELLKTAAAAASITSSTAATPTTTTTTRGLERFDLFRAREKAAARKIVLLACQQKMGNDQIASIARRCSDRAVKHAITLARQDYNEVYPNNC